MGSCNSGGKGGLGLSKGGSDGVPFKKGNEIAPEQAVYNVNAQRYFTDSGFRVNCQRCVWAYEMQRRGYDVEALPAPQGDTLCRNGNWMGIVQNKNNLIAEPVGASRVNAEVKNITNTMSAWGEGSRGIVRMAKGRSGHVFNVEYKNGKVVGYEAQTGQVVDLTSKLSGTRRNYTTLVRTDNVKFNSNEVSKYVKERGKN